MCGGGWLATRRRNKRLENEEDEKEETASLGLRIVAGFATAAGVRSAPGEPGDVVRFPPAQALGGAWQGQY